MKTYKVGLIRVLTTEDEELLQLHGKLIESYFPMFQVVSRCIPEQPEGIHDDETFAVGVPKVVNLAVELWKEGCQAIIISCAGDPGRFNVDDCTIYNLSISYCLKRLF